MALSAIIPLAGPDFDLADGTTKAEISIEGTPLLRRALDRRSWWRRGNLTPDAMCFVLRDTAVSRRFAGECLTVWYPGASTVFLGRETGGAVLSALAGASLVAADGPLCIDLADILYDDDFDPIGHFAADERHGGAGLVFPSDLPCYSYLLSGADGDVVEAAEKRVISDQASAGTYFFRDVTTFVEVVAHALRHADTQAHAGRLFICPLFNGVIAGGGRVTAHAVSNVRDIKMLQHHSVRSSEVEQ